MAISRLRALQQFVIREIFKEAPTGVMRTLPNQQLVDMNVQILAQRLMQNGIDPKTLKNANQVENALNMIENRPPVQQGIRSTGPAKVFNIAGEELDPSKPIMGGTQPGKKINTDAFIRKAQAKETEEQIAKRMREENKEAIKRFKQKMEEDRDFSILDSRDKNFSQKKFDKEIEDLDPEDFAQGGRAGFANGSAGLMSLANKQKKGPGAPSIKYDFDREGPGPFGPPFETNDPEEAAREIVRRVILSEPGLRSEGAKIPISKFGSIIIPDVDKIGAGGLIDLLGGEVEFGGMKDFDTGDKKIGFEFRKKFDKGGMSRRKFMQIMGGLAALPIVGKFFKGAKPAAKIAEVATKSTGGQPPSYFFDLAEKIKILGRESKVSPRERVREIDYKNYTLQEDIATGDMTIVKRKGDPEFAYEEEVMSFRKGQADEMTKGKTPPDEYEELTVRPDRDGKMKDVEDGIEPESVKEIIEEVSEGGGNLNQETLEKIARGDLASGGVAMMLGE